MFLLSNDSCMQNVLEVEDLGGCIIKGNGAVCLLQMKPQQLRVESDLRLTEVVVHPFFLCKELQMRPVTQM